MKKNNLVFMAACFGMFLFGIAMLSLGTINTFLVDKFQLDKLSAGSLASLLPLGILIGSLFFGAIVDRFGYKLLLIISSILIVVCMILIIYAASFPIIQGVFFIIGITGGLINGATNALAADVSSENKSANLSLLGVFYGLGAISLPLVTGILTRHFSYESVILGTAIFLMLPVIYFMVIPFPPPKQQQGIPLKKVFSMFKDKVLILFSFVLFFQSAAEGISNNWTTSYLRDVHGLADDKALFSLTMLVIGMTVARLILSYVLKKMKPIKVFSLSCILIAISLILLQVSGSLAMIWISYFLLGMGLASGFPIMLGYVAERYAELSGIAFSFALVIALLGNTLLNLLVGVVSRTWGIHHITTILIAAACLMFLLATWAFNQNIKKPLK
ncbi:MAG: MFS transporter [Candidatus Marinimicrobia bacterium]|nr:MFS transporter [Candidatus Neomarinimicrobiota bacterium]